MSNTSVEENWMNAPLLLGPRPEAMLSGWRRRLAIWNRRARERAELASLSERDLRDLGLSPGEAAFESAKPFWRA